MKVKKVVITGASRGIGRATAEKFLKEGYFVIGCSRTVRRSGLRHKNFEAITLDLASLKSIRDTAASIKKRYSAIDILVNNAGVLLDYEDQIAKPEKVRDTLEVNLIGLIDFTEQLLPIISDGGHIINLSSGRGSLTQPVSDQAPGYNISKTAVNMYTKMLAARLAPKKITVSSIDPGWVRTEMGGYNAERDPKEAAEDIFNLATSYVKSGNFWLKGRKRPW